MKRLIRQCVCGGLLMGALSASAMAQDGSSEPDAAVRKAYKDLIDAENRHDLSAVEKLVWNSPNTLFVAKAPVGWKGYWGKDDVMQHFHDLYETHFRIDPDYPNEKIVHLTPDVAETYVPVNITAVYGGYPKPAPFIMVLLWVKVEGGWKMATDLPIPVPPEAAKPAVTK
jgi:ketosteroid isomerase-like protein